MKRNPLSCPAFQKPHESDEDQSFQWFVVDSSGAMIPYHQKPLRRSRSYDTEQRKRSRQKPQARPESPSLRNLLPLPKRRLSFINLVLAGPSLDLPEHSINAAAEDSADYEERQMEMLLHQQQQLQQQSQQQQRRQSVEVESLPDWEEEQFDRHEEWEDWVMDDQQRADEAAAENERKAIKWADREGVEVEATSPKLAPTAATSTPARPVASQTLALPTNTPLQIALRVVWRSMVFSGYEIVGWRVGKDVARYMKLAFEWGVDESIPPGPFGFQRKLLEYVVPALVGLLVLRRFKAHIYRQQMLYGLKARRLPPLWFALLYRTCRLFLIYRFFQRVGTPSYYLATLTGIGFAFFRGEGAKDLLHITRWPKYLSPLQGLYALFRSVVYAAAFGIPYSRIALFKPWYRRRLLCKLVFFAFFTFWGQLSQLARSVALSKGPARAMDASLTALGQILAVCSSMSAQ
mmetsp:Transcript_28206/g.45695  ORF Transcript_28206/g.45695 Transcript_28206/m.45695 type:complete len:462 (+) Transcript_28206:74-1459(+)|eukprot:CAMPEP_0184335532 /NCGR_PEP_ID=MMETSP1089-20130417/4085_1 /TAXON_ID=38269 ORGANISM="Gloeochaete wittrockiana, Strain SAG46.84" /NCGR_SAMPLE_ID=MMETSP1089 /ASSEMBLY_ACC=CAM_ASM_000445 /LENGTH=461 /DNA_ID=CAMNT_0026660241 /DNA_START=29 /DNA_END=1414 /DNA_ORIENTATION=+